MLGALCSHPMLKLANWDPWRSMEEVVGAIKAFLEAHGRVVRRGRIHGHGTPHSHSPATAGAAWAGQRAMWAS